MPQKHKKVTQTKNSIPKNATVAKVSSKNDSITKNDTQNDSNKTKISTEKVSNDHVVESIFTELKCDVKQNTPIFFVDVSGSTESRLYTKGEKQIQVMDYEFILVKKISQKMGFNNCHLICWSTKAKLYRNVNPLDLKRLREIKKEIKSIVSGTHMMSGFSLIENDMLSDENDKITDLIILTDGEIDDSKKTIHEKITELSGKSANIRIIAVERGKKDYLNENCQVGNKLFGYIRDGGMTRMVSRFSIFNSLRKEFVNFSNPRVPDGYAPFGNNQMFKKSDFRKFMMYVDDELRKMAENLTPVTVVVSKGKSKKYDSDDESEDVDDDNDIDITSDTSSNKSIKSITKQGAMYGVTTKNDVLRFTHSITLPIYHCTKNMSYGEQMAVIDIFSGMYKRFPEGYDLYQDARKLLIDEINNHIQGRATTFTDSKRKQHLRIENTNMDLMNDVRSSIQGPAPDDKLITSFLIRSTKGHNFVVRCSPKSTLADIDLDKVTYRNSCIVVGKYKVPLMFAPGSSPSNIQSAIQMCRLYYARTLNISPSNPNIWYYLAVDYMLLKLSIKSHTEQKIKDALSDTVLQYQTLITAFLEEEVHSVGRRFIDVVCYNKKLKIEYKVLKNAVKYSGLQINPLSLFMLIVDTFIVDKFDKKVDMEEFSNGVINMCSKQIGIDLNIDVDENELLKAKPLTLVFPSNTVSGSGDTSDSKNYRSSLKQLAESLLSHAEKSKPTTLCFDIVTSDIYTVQSHKFTELDIVCPSRTLPNVPDTVENYPCTVCGQLLSISVSPKTTNKDLKKIEKHFEKVVLCDGDLLPNIVNSILFTDLGMMDGETGDDTLFAPETFKTKDEFVKFKNITIVDPISSSKMRINTQEEFMRMVRAKFPFIADLDMSNVALAGGFVRSILLRQEMKDFDFFFHSLETEEEFKNRLDKLVVDLTNNVRRYHAQFGRNVKFGMFFKPMFNVLEMICFEDPSDHINENFTLENFHAYKYRSLRRYNGDVKKLRDPIVVVKTEKENQPADASDEDSDQEDNNMIGNDDDENSDNNSNDSDSDDSDNSSDSDNDENSYRKRSKVKRDTYYFEDGDEHGIRMRHRFQFVLCKYRTKNDVIKTFDMFPSKVLFDGEKVYFTEKSLRAYRYMINEIRLDGGSTLFKHRLSKYFKYGFSIVFPPNDRDWKGKNHSNNYNLKDAKYQGLDENKGPLSFKIRKMYDNIIIVSHNSNIEKMLERNEQLENSAKEDGQGLYISSLFCSFVSVLRYIDINGIDYVFPQLPKIDFRDSGLSNNLNANSKKSRHIGTKTTTKLSSKVEKDTQPDNMIENAESDDEQQTPINKTDVDDITIDNMPFTTSGIKFKNRTLNVGFVDKCDALYSNRKWYKEFYTSMLLTDFADNNDDDD
ncbi:hypothetical protein YASMINEVIRUS_712 [Yasminevirus sp. GU-2018]|uniref:VWFA domain-containing protein n=1 Tax=Yasminevirus sp. GU-2018 TaxID=2420051 RepID=A0A5K0U836_9VIRU|nr:hypothetical protein YASMINEVIRUS_712 [Yasminevirus sp. GU-2018]